MHGEWNTFAAAAGAVMIAAMRRTRRVASHNMHRYITHIHKTCRHRDVHKIRRNVVVRTLSLRPAKEPLYRHSLQMQDYG